jgi:hypothetical protein
VCFLTNSPVRPRSAFVLTVRSFNPEPPDNNQDYFGDTCGGYSLSSTESFEMRVLTSSLASTKSIRACNSSSSIRIVPNQHDIPSAGIQERRRQRNPYAHPVRIEEPTTLRLQNPRGFSGSSTERTLVPATIRSPRPSPTSTILNLSSTLDQSDSEAATPTKAPTNIEGFETQMISGSERQISSPARNQLQWPISTRVQPGAVAF